MRGNRSAGKRRRYRGKVKFMSMGDMSLNEMQKLRGKLSRKQPGAENLDQLTGVLKKDAAEAQIALRLREGRGGTIFICDVDHLKKINEKYGHQAGDECLRQAAQILSFMAREGDILGRWGGDEFLIYMPNCREQQQARDIQERIENRLRVGGEKDRDKVQFSMTVVWAVWHTGDTWRRLFEYAEEELRKRKPLLELQDGERDERKDQYKKDVQRIQGDLIEQIQKPGAYCRDYKTFKSIYRFLERGIIRGGQKACVILITVVDGQGGSLLPYEKDMLMEQLGRDIESTLRLGDVYTRYSSSQYLALVIDTTEGQADRIVNRIKKQFLADREENDILIHHCYELKPARIGGRIDWDQASGEDL